MRIDRIDLIRDAPADGLIPEERRRVVLIVAATPRKKSLTLHEPAGFRHLDSKPVALRTRK
jgi:hypothetical protein